ncbi:MAG: rhomboid family intramembrane serine protease [Verrucomicrobiales bacterium]|nr:rhomboid family intramembrane serine protease [Verrucomicrobiales bacterium]
MVFPLSDSPNPRGLPWVTYALIAINVAVYLVINLPLGSRPANLSDPALREYLVMIQDMIPRGVSMREVAQSVSAYDLVVFKHGFRPAAPEWQDLITSLFLHGGLMHLFGNMLFLWIYGDNVEHRLGPFRFLLGYLGTGIAATLFYTLFAAGSKVPLVGASGAISGVLGFYFLWFPRNVVRLFVFLFPIFMNVVEVSARLVLTFYLLIDNLLPFLFSRSGAGGVAHGAHLGGFIAGLGAAWLLDRRQLSMRPEEYEGIRGSSEPPILDDSPVDLLRRAIDRGDWEEAARAYFALPAEATRRVLQPELSLELADWLAENGHPTGALTVYRRHLRDFPRGPGIAEAHLGAGRVQLEALRQIAPAYQHFVEALDADPSPQVEAECRAALERIEALQKFPMRRWER